MLKVYRYFIKPFGVKISDSKKILDAGNWSGNDTAWRMVVDLTKIIFFVNSEGKICQEPQRKIFSVIDGIIGGEKEGPLTPAEKKSAVVISGFNPLAVDIAALNLMGFDLEKIKIYQNLLKNDFYFFINNSKDIKVEANFPADYNFGFIPHMGWKDIVK